MAETDDWIIPGAATGGGAAVAADNGYKIGPNGVPQIEITRRPTTPPMATGADDWIAPEANGNARKKPFTIKAAAGALDAGATAAAGGITANFIDELAGLHAAGRAGNSPAFDALPGSSLINLARLGYEFATGKPGEATATYEKARDAMRDTVKTAETEHPTATTIGGLAGALAAPGGALVRGATLPARALRAAGVGAAYGGASGIGEGTTAEDRLTRGAVGTAVGGAAGLVGVPAVEGVVKGVGALASKPIGLIRGALNPTGAANRAVGRAYGEAVTADPAAVNRLAPTELAPGQPQTVMDTLGQPGRNLARSAANISGGARDTLNQTLDDRYVNQAGRLTQWLRDTFHYPDVHAQQQAIDQVGKTVNRSAYNRAYSDPAGHSLWDEGFQQLTAAPLVQDAIRSATRTGANKAAVEGFRPPVNPFQFAADGTVTLKSGVSPSLQFWDSVKRNLDDKIGAFKRSGENEALRDAQRLKAALVDHLDQMVPSYAQARAGAAHFFGAENALEAGQKFVSENFAVPQTRAALAKMSDTERKLFQDGFVSRFVETLEKIPDRADVVRRIFNTPDARQKITLAIGRQRATELEAKLRIENIMQQSLHAVQGNSTTVMQLTAAGLAGAGGGGWLGFDPTTSGLAAALATAGKHGIDTRVANRIAEMLTSTDPAALTRGIRMVANNAKMMSALRYADSAAARIGGGQAQAVSAPAMQLPSLGRADQSGQNDQPVIPRPPGQ